MDTLVFQNTFLLQQVAVMFFVQNFSFIDPFYILDPLSQTEHEQQTK
jgi:hypothetical protein